MRDFVRKRRWVRTRIRVGDVGRQLLPQLSSLRLSVPVPVDDNDDDLNAEKWLDAEEDPLRPDGVSELLASLLHVKNGGNGGENAAESIPGKPSAETVVFFFWGCTIFKEWEKFESRFFGS